jgi:hypothetical protein
MLLENFTGKNELEFANEEIIFSFVDIIRVMVSSTDVIKNYFLIRAKLRVKCMKTIKRDHLWKFNSLSVGVLSLGILMAQNVSANDIEANDALPQVSSIKKVLPAKLNEFSGRLLTTYNVDTGEDITFEDRNGRAIVQGDIDLGSTEQLLAHGYRFLGNKAENTLSTLAEVGPNSIVIPHSGYRWTNSTVPYILDPNLPNNVRNQVFSAINHWQTKTALKFVARTNQSNYIRFQPSNGICSSAVGMQGGEQRVNLDGYGNCGVGATIHEIGHAMGMWHEQSRNDRNEYVWINWDNIQEHTKYNFNQANLYSGTSDDGVDIGYYDYNSIMHYDAYAFAIDRSVPTIYPRDPNIPFSALGQRNGLSNGDIKSVAYMYGAQNNQVVENTYNYNIPDNNYQGVYSPLQVEFSENSGQVKIGVDIKHTYIGDLVVQLIHPDGTVYNLHNQEGGSTNDINYTYTVNLQGKSALGTWYLRAVDLASQDTGYINSWMLEF